MSSSQSVGQWFNKRRFFFAPLVLLLVLPITILFLQERQTIRQEAASVDPGSGTPAPNGPSGDWQLVFSDEFNATSLDTSKWFQLRGDASGPFGDPANPDAEDAYYTKENSYVSNGNLVLNLVKQAAGGYPYSSGWVQTYPAFSYTYGYVEIRAKAPTCDGCWPAFWTIPNDGTWPPEIDAFEFFNEPFPSFNYHWDAGGHKQSGPTNYGTSGVDYTTDYHVYGMVWEPDKIQVFLDGQPGPSYTDAATITSLSQFIILNLALNKGYQPTTTQMLVDYVRVWQKGAATGSPVVATPPPTIALPTYVTPTLYCLGDESGEQCSAPTSTPTLLDGVTPSIPVETGAPTESVPTVPGGSNGGSTTTPTVSPCPTEGTVSVQHRKHHHKHKGGWFRKFFRWLLEFLLELIKKLFGGGDIVIPPPSHPCVTPTPTTEEPEPTVGEEPTMPVEETVTPTTSGAVPTTAAGTKSQVILMPLGDSITDGGDSMGGYRLDLWKKLVGTDGDKIDFVGSMNGGPNDLGDKDHEGHIGWNITELDAQINGWMTSSKPDIVLLHIGTNDLDQGASVDEMKTNLTKLITDIYAAKPDTALVVSSLIVTTVGEKATWTAYNAAIPGIVNTFKSQGKNITYVDMSNSLTESDLDDGAHPTWEGYSKMATVWYPVVKSLYDSMIAK